MNRANWITDVNKLKIESGMLYMNIFMPSIWRSEGVAIDAWEFNMRLVWHVHGFMSQLHSHKNPTFGDAPTAIGELVTLPSYRAQDFARLDPTWVGRVHQDLNTFIQEQYGTL